MESISFETGLAVAFGASIFVLYKEPIESFINSCKHRFNALNKRKLPF